MQNSNGHRNTIQRKIILETLQPMRSHPTIDELHNEVVKEFPAISKTTIYRNLRVLAQNGLIQRILLPDGLERYDGQIHNHYHFQCDTCGLIFDVEINYLNELETAVAQKYGFAIQAHDIVFKGLCDKCQVCEVTIV